MGPEYFEDNFKKSSPTAIYTSPHFSYILFFRPHQEVSLFEGTTLDVNNHYVL